MFFVSFFTESILLIIFLSFPFFLRIYNNSLNPYISQKSDPDSLSFIFAVRDLFLYLGTASGLLVSSFILIKDFSFILLIRIFNFFFNISFITIFKQR